MQVKYGAATLALCRLEHFAIEAAYDDTGRDLLCHDVQLEVSTTLNPFATATNKLDPAAPAGGLGIEGDRLGISVPRLKDLLSTPRQRLAVTIGNDPVLISPGTDAGTGAPFECDVRGGPFPGRAVITENSGDKTARLTWG